MAIEWRKFVEDFRRDPSRMLEMLTPKCLRSRGPPWAVVGAQSLETPPVRVQGFSQWLTADSVVLG